MAAYPSALEPDSIFAKDFKVVRGLRLGGMGAVYVVTQLSTGKQRALKLLASQLVNNADMRERFVREARAAAQIESDHVVEIVTAGVDDQTGAPYIAMELLRGEELADAVDRRGALPLGEVREVLAQIGHALEQAHAQRIVHRDLKPENIFLALPKRRGATFTAKLLDFGVAKFLALGASENGTTPVGSPLFMAPEQTDSFGNICPATDVWALGLLAFYLLTGRNYWLGAERASVPVLLREVCLDPLVKASDRARVFGVPELIPPGFDEWFERCVVREIDDRYVEGGEAVRAFLSAVPNEAPPSRYPAPISNPPSYDPYAVPGSVDKPVLELEEDAPPSRGLGFDATPISLPSDALAASSSASAPPPSRAVAEGSWFEAPLEDEGGGAPLLEGSSWFSAPEESGASAEPKEAVVSTDGSPWFEPANEPPIADRVSAGGSLWFEPTNESASEASPESSWFSSTPSAVPETEGSATEASPAAGSWFDPPPEGASDEEPKEVSAAAGSWFDAAPEGSPEAPNAEASAWFSADPSAEPAAELPAEQVAAPLDRLTPAGVAQEVEAATVEAPSSKVKRVVQFTKRHRLALAGVAVGALVGVGLGLRPHAPKKDPSTAAAEPKPPETHAVEPVTAHLPSAPCSRDAALLFRGEQGSANGPSFCLDRTEVTVQAYEKCLASGICDPLDDEIDYPPLRPQQVEFYRSLCNAGSGRGPFPVNCVDWWTAASYCHWKGGRLPTEEEYALALATVPPPEPGARLPPANLCGDECLEWGVERGFFVIATSHDWDAYQGTSPVGTYRAKAVFADLDGNVAEWTESSPEPESKTDRSRVVVGASFMALPRDGGPFPRVIVAPASKSYAIGFRCAYAPNDPERPEVNTEHQPSEPAPKSAETPAPSASAPHEEGSPHDEHVADVPPAAEPSASASPHGAEEPH